MISPSSPGDLGSTPSHFLIQIVYFFGALCLSTYAACYFPNGSDRNAEYDSEVYQPCNRSAEYSMCCRAPDHKCRSDGLCFDAWTRLVWRESCTDPSWNSSACVKLCNSETVSTIEGLVSNQANTDYTITPCPDGSYCCGNGTVADDCCKENRGLPLSGGKALVQDANSASDITSPSPIEATPSSSSSATLTLHQSSGSLTSIASLSLSSEASVPSSLTSVSPSAAAATSHQTGAIVGSAIGAAAAAALITVIIFLLRMRRIKHQQSPSHDIQQVRGIDNFTRSSAIYPELATSGPTSELEDSEESRKPVPELEDSTRRQ